MILSPAILPAALEPGCHTIYTEDLNHGQTYAGVRVIDPFAGSLAPHFKGAQRKWNVK